LISNADAVDESLFSQSLSDAQYLYSSVEEEINQSHS